MMPRLTMLLFVVLYSLISLSQTEKVEYKYGFDFVEGVYLSYDDFLNNDPSIKKKDIVELKPYSKEFRDINKGILGIDFINKEGEIEHIKAPLMWGYCLKNDIYIRFKNGFSKLKKIGSICYFIEYRRATDEYERTYSVLGYVGGQKPRKSHNYIFDIDSGTILRFKHDNFEKLIVNDDSLYNEFNNLGDDKSKSKFMFQFLELYNERNPVYFPIDPLEIFDASKAVEIEFD